MNRLSPLLLLLLAGVPPAGEAPVIVRVLTYNIHHGEGTDRRLDLERVARVIERLQPDLVALQEVDVGTDRAGGANQVAVLAHLTAMHAEFGKAMDFDGGGYGVAVLSRWPLAVVGNHALPGAPDREPRAALTVRLRPGARGLFILFTSTHLDQGRDPQNRLAQANALNELLVRDDTPSILAGDMNARQDTDVMQALEAVWANTSAAAPVSDDTTGRPRSRGDHVLLRPGAGWWVIEWRVIDETIASDHRPVLVVLEWAGMPRTSAR
jgi:endonuclease/exonuclease/phosphatase family metal-dependent hydrolase